MTLVPLLDYEEEEDDEDEPHIICGDMPTSEESSTTFPSESPTPRPKAKPVVAAGPFHHRLATPRDVDTHAKVAEALRKVDGPIKNQESDSDEEEEEEEDSEEEEQKEEEEKTDPELAKRLREGEEDGEEEVSLRWKSDLATKARDAFYTRQSGTANLRKLVYGQQQVNTNINLCHF
jgi:hypothetical protein